jgi:hypothetical protein
LFHDHARTRRRTPKKERKQQCEHINDAARHVGSPLILVNRTLSSHATIHHQLRKTQNILVRKFPCWGFFIVGKTSCV